MSNEDKEKKPAINLTVDNKQSIELARENERLKMKLGENEEDVNVHTSDNKSIAEGVKDALRQKYQDKGHIAPTLETDADLQNAIAILKDLPEKHQYKAPSGVAELNDAQYGNQRPPTYDAHGNLLTKKYKNEQDMVRDLYDILSVHQGDPRGQEATKYIELLTRQIFKTAKETNCPLPVYQRPMPETVDVNGLRVPRDPNSGDLQIWNVNYRRRKLLERQERGSVAVKPEGDQK